MIIHDWERIDSNEGFRLITYHTQNLSGYWTGAVYRSNFVYWNRREGPRYVLSLGCICGCNKWVVERMRVYDVREPIKKD